MLIIILIWLLLGTKLVIWVLLGCRCWILACSWCTLVVVAEDSSCWSTTSWSSLVWSAVALTYSASLSSIEVVRSWTTAAEKMSSISSWLSNLLRLSNTLMRRPSRSTTTWNSNLLSPVVVLVLIHLMLWLWPVLHPLYSLVVNASLPRDLQAFIKLIVSECISMDSVNLFDWVMHPCCYFWVLIFVVLRFVVVIVLADLILRSLIFNKWWSNVDAIFVAWNLSSTRLICNINTLAISITHKSLVTTVLNISISSSVSLSLSTSCTASFSVIRSLYRLSQNGWVNAWRWYLSVVLVIR